MPNLFTFNFDMNRSLATAICGVLLLVGIGFSRPKPTDPLVKVRDAENRFWTEKTFAPPQYDLVVIGDSRIYRGVSTAALKEALPGYKVLNFGFSSAGLANVLLAEGEAKLSNVSAKKAVVLGITPWSLTLKAAENSHLKQELERPLAERLQRLYFNPLFSNLAPITPKQLKAIFKGGEKPPKILYHQIHHSNGWVESWKVPSDSREQLEPYHTLFDQNRVDSDTLNALARRIESWTKQGIQVFAFRPPTTFEMVQLENMRSGFDEAAVRDRIEASGGRWIEFSSEDYASYDGSHLDRESALRFSRELGRKISDHLR